MLERTATNKDLETTAAGSIEMRNSCNDMTWPTTIHGFLPLISSTPAHLAAHESPGPGKSHSQVKSRMFQLCLPLQKATVLDKPESHRLEDIVNHHSPNLIGTSHYSLGPIFLCPTLAHNSASCHSIKKNCDVLDQYILHRRVIHCR